MTAPSRKVPRGTWQRVHEDELGVHWRQKVRRLYVISQLEDMELPGGGGASGPTWHVSVSRNGRRCSDQALDLVRLAFDLHGAEEDNHHPGVARHLFMPVDQAYRLACECKTDETVVREPDGYTWTNPTDGPCRGCSLEALTGKPCPLHRRAPSDPATVPGAGHETAGTNGIGRGAT